MLDSFGLCSILSNGMWLLLDMSRGGRAVAFRSANSISIRFIRRESGIHLCEQANLVRRTPPQHINNNNNKAEFSPNANVHIIKP